MSIQPIHTKTDYSADLKSASNLADVNPRFGTPAADRLKALGPLVQTYKAKQYASELPGILIRKA